MGVTGPGSPQAPPPPQRSMHICMKKIKIKKKERRGHHFIVEPHPSSGFLVI